VHLAHDPLGLRVHAFDAAVVVRQGPGRAGVGGSVGQDVNAFAGLGVDEHSGVAVAVAVAQGEVVDSQDTGHLKLWQGQPQQLEIPQGEEGFADVVADFPADAQAPETIGPGAKAAGTPTFRRVRSSS
jgi:hypothetical protein